MQVAGHPAYFIVVSGASGPIHAIAAEVVLVRPGWMYSLTCTAAGKTPDQAETAWNSWRPVFLASSAPLIASPAERAVAPKLPSKGLCPAAICSSCSLRETGYYAAMLFAEPYEEPPDDEIAAILRRSNAFMGCVQPDCWWCGLYDGGCINDHEPGAE